MESIVPSWARATNPPASALGSIPEYNTQGADGVTGTYAAGNVVRRSNVVYLCTRNVNVANFGALYAPGTGSDWPSRWERLGVPSGGTANQALAKSADNSAVAWRAVSTLIANGSITVGKLAVALVARLLPTGGSDGQFLSRSSGSPAWVAAPEAGDGSGNDATARAAAASNTRLIRRLQDLTTDLHAGPLSTGWSDASADAQGGIAAVDSATLDGARAVTDWTNQSLNHEAGKHTVARIPAGADPRLFRMKIEGTGSQVAFETFNTLQYLGASADEQWALYFVGTYGDAVTTVTLQVTGSLAHLGETRFDGILGDGADGIRASLADVQNRSRDLHLDGAHRLVTNADAAVAGIAAVGILRSQELAIENGDTPLDVQGVTFAASIANPDFDASTPTRITKPVIRLKATENRGDWRLRFVAREHPVDLLAGGWVPITVSNGTAGFDYYISGHASGAVSFLKNTEVTTFHGTLAGGIVKLLNLAAETVARLLPTGGGDGKFLGHADGSPAWVDAPGGGGTGLTAIGNSVTISASNNFADFDTTTRDAFFTAWNDRTYTAYVLVLTSGTNLYVSELIAPPDAPNNLTSSSTFRLRRMDSSIDPALGINATKLRAWIVVDSGGILRLYGRA
ncbi:MAG: hypothetical protein F4205_18155 [Gemmatimonadetes bacterium]|nr:hypothetical protein [Gemmatimonadota bacterium]